MGLYALNALALTLHNGHTAQLTTTKVRTFVLSSCSALPSP
jgi:hypothetical protein